MATSTKTSILLLGILIGTATTLVIDVDRHTEAEGPLPSAKRELQQEPHEAGDLTSEQQRLVDFALSRFNAQGLDLPEIEIVFHDSLRICGGHTGLYHEKTRTLQMCSLEKDVMLHELAHAWANYNLSESQKADFAAFRGLKAWNDHELAWEDRGTEQAAEIIAWALLDRPNHVRWVETTSEGRNVSSFRLLTIENSDVDSMAQAFRFLTGKDSIFRSAEEWQSEDAASFSPETRAPTEVIQFDSCADKGFLVRIGHSAGC